MTYQSFDEWKTGDQAQVVLRCIYEAMRLNSHHHDVGSGEGWRRKSWYHHVNKAWFHLLPQFENEKEPAMDTYIKLGSAPPTKLPHLILAVTRASFVLAQWAQRGLLPFIPIEGPVVDISELERAGE